VKIFSLIIRIGVILLAWAMIFTGCSSSKIDDPATEKPTYRFSIKEGKRLFHHLCFPCHGEGGKGDGIHWASAIDITPADLSKFTPAESSRIFQTIKYGSEAQGKSNLCPPWQNNISDEEIGYIVAYIGTLK